MKDGVIKIHDLVLDAMRARYGEQELRDGHLRFAAALLKHEPFEATTAHVPLTGFEVDWYVSTHLSFHVAHCIEQSAPLQESPNFDDISRWLEDNTMQLNL